MTTHGDWPRSVRTAPLKSPVGLYLQSGSNRLMRRKMREHKHDPMPPATMVPAVKRLNEKTGRVEYVASR